MSSAPGEGDPLPLGGRDRKAPDDRREQILLAAARVIAERGFGETRVTDVARSAGISSGLVIYYFGTRDQLLTEALRYSEDRFHAAMSAHLGSFASPPHRLAELVRLSCAPHPLDDLPGSWVLWFDLWAQSVRHSGLAADREELDHRWRASVADIVRDGQAAGDFAGVDPARFALSLTALLDGLAVQVALGDPVVSPELALSVAIDHCARWLGPGIADAVAPAGPGPARSPE